ncbi:hypothetical protein EXIGLDRAFT_289616 [Exidia glandulosa HHB12029]|uniref:Uncharacterized protein n=1 Tax=Exidia glandulosa HHB12029 TaxID=1314781 RepID=A0A165DFD4_EXIGL|nr:hypothetical protein EXIGLDRAFT_289616 [Exidia glandulosa HHB12029]
MDKDFCRSYSREGHHAAGRCRASRRVATSKRAYEVTLTSIRRRTTLHGSRLFPSLILITLSTQERIRERSAHMVQRLSIHTYWSAGPFVLINATCARDLNSLRLRRLMGSVL